jgi:hypothetical protein
MPYQGFDAIILSMCTNCLKPGSVYLSNVFRGADLQDLNISVIYLQDLDSQLYYAGRDQWTYSIDKASCYFSTSDAAAEVQRQPHFRWQVILFRQGWSDPLMIPLVFKSGL